MRTLVVDDEPFTLKVLVHQLAGLGLQDVVAYQSATAALAFLESGGAPVELIFLDLQMPELDGVEFVRNLVRIRYTGKLVLVSGEDERIIQAAEKLTQAHKLNVIGALRKPASPAQLRAMLESMLQRVQAASREKKNYGPDALRHAIANAELVNYYQPKVALASCDIVGLEALVRWQHPQDGLIAPDQFIPLAEEHGLIDALTEAVLTTAVQQARRWRDAGIDLKVAINISMDNLQSLDFPDFLARKAAEAGIPVTSLILEVTESRLMKNPLASLDILTRLRLKRIGLSIDDFGTGHSSLAQLRDLPFEELKIDRSFVHGAAGELSLRAIFEASLGMARQLGLTTVAEGVEDWADWDFLREARCDVAQGYFISRPLPAESVPGWLEGWSNSRIVLLEGRR